MSSRFTETNKWSDPWFQSLTHGSKLLFMYLCDRCNTAGFYEENMREACFHLGITDDQYKGALKGLERGIISVDGWLWVKNFLRHQKNKDLNPENLAHRGVIRLLQEQLDRFSSNPDFQSFIAPLEALFRVSCNSKGKEGEEVKEKRSKFTKPTVDQVQEEMTRQEVVNPKEEAKMFIAHFSSNGWKIGGKAPMKDWPSAVTTWKHRQKANGANGHSGNGKHNGKRFLSPEEHRAEQARLEAQSDSRNGSH